MYTKAIKPPAKDPDFDTWSVTWEGTWALFRFYWNAKRNDDGFPDYV